MNQKLNSIRLLLSVFIFTTAFSASNDPYLDQMSQAITQLKTSQSIADYQACANVFERIAKVENEQWLPNYYAAYAYVLMSFQEPDGNRKDLILDKAQLFIDEALKLAPKESELYVLQAFLYPSRIMVDPMGRGMHYVEKVYEALAIAKQNNSENPRIYFLEATFALNMPEAMGGGAKIARPLFEMARDKFKNYYPATVISPNWGNDMNEASLNGLNNSTKEVPL